MPDLDMPEDQTEGSEVEGSATASSAAQAVPTRTPLFEGMHADWYRRQALIRQIETTNGNRLICYVCDKDSLIDRDDTLGFVELLYSIPQGSNIDLLLHTAGGDIDAAEKLISLVRRAAGKARLRVIVPDFAKSAGTLMALAADAIVMSESSELGPIDPQITMDDGRGNRVRHSILNYLLAYEHHAAAVHSNPGDVAAQIMLGKLDPTTVIQFMAAKDRTRKFAEDQLLHGMFRSSPGLYTAIASALMDITRWQSHGQMIRWEDAKQVGLVVEYLEPKSKEWLEYWRLYCLQRLAIKARQKLFESDYVSLPIES